MDKLYQDLNTIEDAARGMQGDDQKAIAETGLHVVSTLLRKNRDYGSTASRTPELAPDVTPETAIRVRLSDKVARIRNLLGNSAQVASETLADTFLDLAGYSILEVISIGVESRVSITDFMDSIVRRQQQVEGMAALLSDLCTQFSQLDGNLTPAECLLKLREEMDAINNAADVHGG